MEFSSGASRKEIANDLFGRANADLDVIELAKAGTGIQCASFHKKAAYSVERLIAFLLTKLVDRFDHRAIKESDLKRSAAILQHGGTRSGAELQICFMGILDESKRLSFRQIEAIAQLDNRTQHCGSFDSARPPLRLRFRPAQSACATVFPKINPMAKPIPRILARLKVVLSRHDTFDQAPVATVVSNEQ